MTPLEIAILRTVLYADVFDFPLTVTEIYHYLIHDETVPYADVKHALDQSPVLQQHLVIDEPYVALAHRVELVGERKRREHTVARLWPLALRYGTWLSRLPFVRMVALTGALAVRNTPDDDDLDYLVVTAPNRVWLARAFAILLVRFVRLRGIVVCPNYVVAENALEQQRKDLFIAHEIAQMVPLSGHDLYWHFRAINDWAGEHLANAKGPFHYEHESELSAVWDTPKQLLELLLAGKLGDMLENWEYQRKLRRFASAMNTPHSSAQLDKSQVKGHFHDYGHIVLHKYQQRLQAYNLAEEPLPLSVNS